ncbi:MAG: hypothetical protein U0524_02405 [Candidatus Saccharimonadales bacterium]
MYSGSTITRYSGQVLGAHQKIDRVARRQLEKLLPQSGFPTARSITHFEGDNGPDGVKRKSPGKDEPWHFFQPFDSKDTKLITDIEDHYHKLVNALRIEDRVRAAFEAAWLSHAIVDGLTPAHHYPYEEKLVELSSGRAIEGRTSVAKKIFAPGESVLHSVTNNWKIWGPKGLITTHAAFESGVAMLIAPMHIRHCRPNADKIKKFSELPLDQWFREVAQDVARLELYDSFYKSGWTIPLARRVRDQLAPALVQAVTLAWYGAALEAQKGAK